MVLPFCVSVRSLVGSEFLAALGGGFDVELLVRGAVNRVAGADFHCALLGGSRDDGKVVEGLQIQAQRFEVWLTDRR
jgi:hypothetical protein